VRKQVQSGLGGSEGAPQAIRPLGQDPSVRLLQLPGCPTDLLRFIRFDLAQVSGRDDQRPAIGGIATSHLAAVQMFNHREQPIVATEPHAIVDLQRWIALPFIQPAKQIDEHPRQTLLDNFIPPSAEAITQAA
jgi:hypothetical protein